MLSQYQSSCEQIFNTYPSFPSLYLSLFQSVRLSVCLSYIYIYIYIYDKSKIYEEESRSVKSSSSSSCHAISTGILDPLSPPLPIAHRFQLVIRLHDVSTQSCSIIVRDGCPAVPRPCEEVHKSTSLMSSSLLLQQCPACLVRLILIVFVMGDRWP